MTYRRADAVGDAGGAFNLGVLLHQQREFAAAAAAYERAERRGIAMPRSTSGFCSTSRATSMAPRRPGGGV